MYHHIQELSSHESVEIFRALGSPTRARIIELLSRREMNIGELSTALGLAQPSITKHVQILEESGLVESLFVPAPQGMQKRCRKVFDRLLVDLTPKMPNAENVAESELPVGMYSDGDFRATCGLATKDKFIGLVDSPLSFYLPERSQAEIIWSAGGWVDFAFPNTIPLDSRILGLELAMEISSEAPGYALDFPSDITVWVNGVDIGTWTSPGDFGGTRGLLNPAWYPENMNQWGEWKTWHVDESGSFVDGVQVRQTQIQDLHIAPWQVTKVRIGNAPDAVNTGGFTLFGRGFGNYQAGLTLRLIHEFGRTIQPGSPKRRAQRG